MSIDVDLELEDVEIYDETSILYSNAQRSYRSTAIHRLSIVPYRNEDEHISFLGALQIPVFLQ